MLWKLLSGLLLAYLAYGVLMVWLHPRFIYPFQNGVFDHPAYEQRIVPVAGAADLPVYVTEAPDGAPTLIYFMGNVGALEAFLSILEYHRAQGLRVVAMTYRGGGGTSGEASEARLKADALAVYDAFGAEGPVLVHGYSLGTGLAMHVAARRPVDAVLLSAPYDKMCALMARASYLPACALPFVQKWASVRDAGGVSAPVTILHGDQDALIPEGRSAVLADALRAAGKDVSRTLIADAAHADLMSFPAYLEALDQFAGAQP